MNTELELEFKKETGLRAKPPDNIICPDCGEIVSGDIFYTSEYVEFLISKIEKLTIENYENNKRSRKTD
jgi:hypothetical protein